jgi:hypothetical protein
VLTEDLVVALAIVAGTILLSVFGFKNEIRAWRQEVRERDQADQKALANISGPYDKTIPILAQLPPPRTVRMTFRGKSTPVIFPAILLLLAALNSRDYLHPTADWQKQTIVSFFQFACALAIVLGLFQWRIYVRHRHLVMIGEVAIGRIIKNYGSARNGQYLRYQFNTQSGETLSKIRTSWKLLDAGMRIPVFYDPCHPKTHVALFAAYYEVDVREQAGAICPPNVAKS